MTAARAIGMIRFGRKTGPSPLHGWQEPTDDEWCHPLLDGEVNYAGKHGWDEYSLGLRAFFRRMRKKARMADMLLESNKRLRAVVRNHELHLDSEGNHVPSDLTRAQVTKLVGLGLSPKEIGAFMMLSAAVVKKHYPEELAYGEVAADIQVLETFHQIATNPDHPGVVTAGKKWLEARRKEFKPVSRVEHAEVAAPPPIIDSRRLSREEREQLRELMMKMVPADGDAVGALEDGVVAEQFQEGGDEPE